MQVGVAGDIDLTISQESFGGFGLDVDFICWGPFASLAGSCNNLTGANEVDCSYSPAAVEQCNINNAQVGEFYILLITNFSDQPGTIDFLQTSGNGATDCNILDPCTADAGADASFCVGGSTVLGGSPTATGGSNIFTYSWTPTAGLDDPASPNPTASPNVTTTYTLTVNDGQGCVVQDDVTVTIETEPNITIAAPDQLNCFNASIQIDASNSAAGTYLWSTLDGNILSGGNSSTPVVDQAGTYTLQVTSAAGCQGEQNVTVSILPDLDVDATLSGDDYICDGESSTLSIETDQAGNWEAVYSLNGVPQNPVQFSGISFQAEVTLAGLYELVSITNDLCDVTVNGSIDLFSEPLPAVNFPDLPVQICPGVAGTAFVDVSGVGDITFTYEFDGVTQPAVTMPAGLFELPYNAQGTFVPLTVSSAECAGQVAGLLEVNEFAPPTAEFEQDYVICSGEFAQVQIDLTGSAPFTYDFNIDGIYQGTNTTFSNSETILSDQPGVMTITELVDAFCEGTALNSSTIQENQLPTAMISGGDTICSDQEIVLPIDLTGTGEFSITYSYNNVIQDPIITSDPQYILTVNAPGTYQITSVSDQLCTDGVQNATQVVHYPPISAALQFDDTVCVGDTVLVNALVSGGQDDGYDYLWTDSVGSQYTENPITLVADEHQYVSLVVNDACDLPNDSQEAFIEVQQYPEPEFVVSADSVCIGEPVVFTRTAEDASVLCTWTFETGSPVLSCEDAERTFFESGYQGLSLSTETSAGCQTILEMDSVVYVVPDAIASFNFEPMEGTIFSPEVQFLNTSTDAVEFLWDFGDGEFSEKESPLHLYPGAVSDFYLACLTSFNLLGCSADTCQTVFIEPEFLMSVPNAFTPDGDGLNDLFAPVFNDIELAEYSLRIFDRFGELIFETEDQFQAWNGQGAKSDDFFARDGIYSYHITAREQNRSLKREFFGTVTIFR